MIDAKEYLKKMSAELDGPIKSYIGNEEPPNLMDASKQYPYAGGKRMRPAMAVACCGAVGGDRSKAVPLAVAIEYIHNFTLIHDDLMDGDEKRRGMDTIHVNYGMPTAVLAGDALFAKAFQIICDLDIPAEKMREVLRYVSQSVWDLARGQQMDVNNEGQIVTEDVYIETIKLKTSVLFAAAAAGGAIIGGADEGDVCLADQSPGGHVRIFLQKLVAVIPDPLGAFHGQGFCHTKELLQLQMTPMIHRIANAKLQRLGKFQKPFIGRLVSGDVLFGDSVGPHQPPFVVVAGKDTLFVYTTQPDLHQIIESAVFIDLLGI